MDYVPLSSNSHLSYLRKRNPVRSKGCMGGGRTNPKKGWFCLSHCLTWMDPIWGFKSLKLAWRVGTLLAPSSMNWELATAPAAKDRGGWVKQPTHPPLRATSTCSALKASGKDAHERRGCPTFVSDCSARRGGAKEVMKVGAAPSFMSAIAGGMQGRMGGWVISLPLLPPGRMIGNR